MTLIHLRSASTSFAAVTDNEGGLPIVLHWGTRLPDSVTAEHLDAALRAPVPHCSTDDPMPRRLLPLPVDRWRLRPGLRGAAPDGTRFAPCFRTAEITHDEASLIVTGVDDAAGLTVELSYTLHPDGLLQVGAAVTNSGHGPYAVAGLESSVPIPMDAVEILDLTGRWCRERTPQRMPLGMGTWLRESFEGRPSHDGPLAICAGDPGFGFRDGRVWAIHLAWSGECVSYAERSPGGFAQLGAGEVLAPGEMILAPGETYDAPDLFAAYSDDGLDGVSRAFHGYVRSRPSHPSTPRPVLLNTWEAVYFDHRLEVLTELADAAAQCGIERFVLDDGWFGSRRNDTKGLGDWTVSSEVWPDGLTPLIDHVRSRGMDFGIWVEPEMANPDSDLLREHPEWMLAVEGRVPSLQRNQQMLDLANEECFAHILERLDALLSENAIAFVKWDDNRGMTDGAHQGRAAAHGQTLAVYRLFDTLRERHPGVEFETCASGGGRVDLGILARTDRIWASDCIDAIERQQINLWTSLVMPPEVIGQHIGGPHSHTTGRTTPFALRAASAVFGHLGVEWNVATLTPAQRRMVTTAVEWHKEHRALLHSGDVVRIGDPTRPTVIHGVVARDRGEAIFSYAQIATNVAEIPGLLRVDGLDRDAVYTLTPVTLGEIPGLQQKSGPSWWSAGGADLPGALLMDVGVSLPVLHPEQALLIHLRRR